MNFGQVDKVNYDATAMYAAGGDCLALSPKVFGNPGRFVQSDMQFAQ